MPKEKTGARVVFWECFLLGGEKDRIKDGLGYCFNHLAVQCFIAFEDAGLVSGVGKQADMSESVA